ncbi:hypothetical protein [Cytobacillus pseudoceanisediminis]
MITKETAKRKLTRKLNHMFTKEEQKNLSFLPDQEDDKSVSWIFVAKDQKIELTCCLKQGIIITASAPAIG